MALTKREYKSNETVISAENLNEIQDAVIALETAAEEEKTGTLTAIDFTNFDNGSFTEVIDGETITHTVTFDDSGRPVTIDGVAITWG